MSIMWLVYFAGIVEGLSIMLLLLSIIGLWASIMWIVFYSTNGTKLKPSKLLIACSIFGMFLSVALPSEKTLYTMAGVYVGEKIVTSDHGKEIGDKITKLIHQKLDNELRKR